MMSRRGGAKIHSSVQAQQPFSWVLGDGSVIGGLELAILGGDEGLDPSVDKPLKPLLPGGARRVIVSQKTGLGYGTKNADWTTNVFEVGPVPPEGFRWRDTQGDMVESYVRFKNIYLNENRMDQPDLILDIKLLSVEDVSGSSSRSSTDQGGDIPIDASAAPASPATPPMAPSPPAPTAATIPAPAPAVASSEGSPEGEDIKALREKLAALEEIKQLQQKLSALQSQK